nr:DUF4105 domain-containing protein [Delftia acidovorans]
MKTSTPGASAGPRFWARVARLALLPLAAWGCGALWFQFPAGAVGRGAAAAAWGAFSLAVLAWPALAGPGRRGRRAWAAGYALAAITLLGWWHTLQPSNDRLWADDVQRMLQGSVQAGRVRLDNVRNFEWRSDTDYTARWETRNYDLEHLRSVDMILSTWGMPAIAHTLVSFGFDDGRHLVFSVEIRKERTEAFSELGGLFKQFELSVVAADERDIVFVRTRVRGERVFLYPVHMPVPAMRALFLSYVDTANSLHRAPRFYHTLTANCTTLVYRMVRAIVPGLPADYRIMLSGLLPEYLYEHGGLDTSRPLAALRRDADIGERARQAGNTPNFSTDIRQTRPPPP